MGASRGLTIMKASESTKGLEGGPKGREGGAMVSLYLQQQRGTFFLPWRDTEKAFLADLAEDREGVSSWCEGHRRSYF